MPSPHRIPQHPVPQHLTVACAPPHEHAWSTRSRHATSAGWVLYVQCLACGTWRVDAQTNALLPPVPVSAAVERPRHRAARADPHETRTRPVSSPGWIASA